MDKKILRTETIDLAVKVLAEFKKLPDIRNVSEIDARTYINGREKGLGVMVFFKEIAKDASLDVFEASWSEYRNCDDLVLYTGWSGMPLRWENGVPSEDAYASKKFFSTGKGAALAAKRCAIALHEAIQDAANSAKKYAKGIPTEKEVAHA